MRHLVRPLAGTYHDLEHARRGSSLLTTSPLRGQPVFHSALFALRFGRCMRAMSECIRSSVATTVRSAVFPKSLPAYRPQRQRLCRMVGRSRLAVCQSDPYSCPSRYIHARVGSQPGAESLATIESQDPLHVMNKPSHLSVMNYLYQTTGLIVTDTDFLFDYARYTMATLDESALWESQGISLAASGINVTYTVRMRYKCRSDDERITQDAGQVNWDCDPGGVIQETSVSANITGDFDSYGSRVFSRLAVTDEWDQLIFTGGMLNRQRSMLPPLLLVRTPLPTPAIQTTPLPPAAGPPPGSRLLVLHTPIGQPAATELYLEALKAKQ